MKNVKTILCLISLLVAGITNVWGADAETDQYKWVESTKTLTIKASGFDNGIIPDYGITSNKPTWKDSYKSVAQHLIIEDDITTIGTQAFNGFDALTSVVLPASLETAKQGAFALCTILEEVRFKGSPDEWACIDFQSSDEYRRSHPFYANATSAKPTDTRKFAFYYTSGSAPSSVDLVFTSAISEIKPYAFYGATNITDVYIQGTISAIGDYALYCSINRLYSNRKKAPATGTNSISWLKSGTYLYLREDATTSYKSTPYYNATSNSTNGAKTIGYSGDQDILEAGKLSGTGTIYKVSGDFDNIIWSLDTTGTLLLEGNGTISTSYAGSPSSSNCLPWSRFRRLVNKAIIKANGGDISNLNDILRYHYALKTIIFEQTTIPTHSYIISETNNRANDFDKLFDKRKNVELKISAASLKDASASNLGLDPWNNAKLDIALSDDVTVDETDYNAGTMLHNIHKYIEKNINLKFDRANMKNTYFNTFCSPIPLSAEEVSSIFGEADIRTLTSSSYDEESQTLTLNFSDPATPITTIDSGVPYLIQPEKEVDFSTITFENLAPSKVVTSAKKVTGEHVNFYGTLGKVDVTEGQIDNASFLFLLADNKLTYATEGSLKGMRAYFILNPSAPAGALAHRPVLNLGDEQTPTAIDKTQTEVKAEKVMENGVMYIIKNGVKYSMMGERVR